MPSYPLKMCRDCGEAKPMSDFYRHTGMADGYLSSCTNCVCARVREHRARDDKVRDYDRRRAQTPERKLRAAEARRHWRLANPEKYKAHNALNNAVRDGRVIKPENCQQCGSTDSMHGHHRDYNLPLDVEWLCARCHHVGHAAAI